MYEGTLCRIGENSKREEELTAVPRTARLKIDSSCRQANPAIDEKINVCALLLRPSRFPRSTGFDPFYRPNFVQHTLALEAQAGPTPLTEAHSSPNYIELVAGSNMTGS